MPVTFLKHVTVVMTKMPAYSLFKGPFEIVLDYKLMEMLLQSTNPNLTDDRKALLFLILQKLDPKTNVLILNHFQSNKMGRFYAGLNKKDGKEVPGSKQSLSPVVLPRHIKHTIFTYMGWIDIDIVKCHPNIMVNIARVAKIDIPHIKRYIEECDVISKDVQRFYSPEDPDASMVTLDQVKLLFNTLIYGGGVNSWFTTLEEDGIDKRTNEIHPFVSGYKQDCTKFMDLVYANNPDMVTTFRANPTLTNIPEYKMKMKVVSYFIQSIENEIIYIAAKILLANGLMKKNSFALEYDGICFKPEKDPNTEAAAFTAVLLEINNNINAKTGMNITMKWKSYNPEHILDDIIEERMAIPVVATRVGSGGDGPMVELIAADFNLKNDWIPLEHGYDVYKQAIEKDHFKCCHEYIKLLPNGTFTRYTKNQMQNANQQYNMDVSSGKKLKKKYMADMWMDDPTIRSYEVIGCYPPPLVCPSNTYNTWTPFDIETVIQTPDEDLTDEDRINNQAECDFILAHLKSAANYNEVIYDHILGFIGHMLKYPANKILTPHFIGQMGSGKTMIFQILARMMGSSKVMLTRTPETDVFGAFNELLDGKILIALDELTAAKCRGALEIIKGLQTGDTITINSKGEKKRDTPSYLHFIVFGNILTMDTYPGDRRNMMFETSSEHCKDGVYFDRLVECYHNDQALKLLYNHVTSHPLVETFHKIKVLPLSQYQANMQDSFKSEVEIFIEHYIGSHEKQNYTEIIEPTADVYQMYGQWKVKFGSEYKTCHKKFVRDMLTLNFANGNNIIEKRRMVDGNSFVINNTFLRDYYGLDNISQVNMPSGLIPGLIPITTTATINPEFGGGETMESFNRVTCPSSSLARRPREDDPNEIEEDFNAIVKPKEKKSKGTNTIRKSNTL